mmetsp:Transcript_11835/g.31813  ORF Transcript_11835/g.31813 Transcript_11835/m.31813 type:complete len:310 (-) Transcript_11835:338-1267(-)
MPLRLGADGRAPLPHVLQGPRRVPAPPGGRGQRRRRRRPGHAHLTTQGGDGDGGSGSVAVGGGGGRVGWALAQGARGGHPSARLPRGGVAQAAPRRRRRRGLGVAELGAVRHLPPVVPLGMLSLQPRGAREPCRGRGRALPLRRVLPQPRRGAARGPHLHPRPAPHDHEPQDGVRGGRRTRGQGRGGGARRRPRSRRQRRAIRVQAGHARPQMVLRAALPARVPVPVQVHHRRAEARWCGGAHLLHVRAGVRRDVPGTQHQPPLHLLPRLGALPRVLARGPAHPRVPRAHGGVPRARAPAGVHARARLG